MEYYNSDDPTQKCKINFSYFRMATSDKHQSWYMENGYLPEDKLTADYLNDQSNFKFFENKIVTKSFLEDNLNHTRDEINEYTQYLNQPLKVVLKKLVEDGQCYKYLDLYHNVINKNIVPPKTNATGLNDVGDIVFLTKRFK